MADRMKNPYPVATRVIAFGGLALVLSLFGWKWMAAVIGLAGAYHVYYRVRYGEWLFYDNTPPFRRTPAYRVYHRLRFGYWPKS